MLRSIIGATSLLLPVLTVLAPSVQGDFLDFRWEWLPEDTPEDYAGQFIWWNECVSGPLLFPCCAGCFGRFDFDSDWHVTLRDFAAFQWRFDSLTDLWRWLPEDTPEDYLGQFIWWNKCARGPLVAPCCVGCFGRFDFDGDRHVTQKDFAVYQRTIK